MNYGYDGSRRVTSVTATNSDGTYKNEYTYTDDRLTQVKHNTSANEADDVVYNFAYDGLGRPTTVHVGDVLLSQNTYDNDRFGKLRTVRYVMVNMKDLNGTMSADQALGTLFLDAAREVNVPCTKGLVPLMGGSTDSAAFTQGGFRSIGITGLSHRLEDYYHTRKDSYDNLDEAGLKNGYLATIRFIEKLSEQ